MCACSLEKIISEKKEKKREEKMYLTRQIRDDVVRISLFQDLLLRMSANGVFVFFCISKKIITRANFNRE